MHWMKYDPNEAATLSVLNPSKPTSGGGNDLAACTASIESVRLIDSRSNCSLVVRFSYRVAARSPVAPKKTRASDWASLIVASSGDPSLAGFFQMAAKFIPHRRHELVLEVCVSARAETFVEGRRKDRRGYGFVYRSFYRPPPFPGIRHPAGKLRKCWVLDKRGRHKVQKPGSDHASASPKLGNIRQIEVVLIKFGVA